MQQLGVRLAAIASLIVLVAAGVWLSGKAARDSRARVEALAMASTDDAAARNEADAPEDRKADGPAYQKAVAADAQRFGLDSVDATSMHAPNRHAIHLQDARLLRPGRHWSSPHLTVSVRVDKVTYERHGAKVAAPHVVASVRNVSDVPVAYNLRLRSTRRGHCEVRGVHPHNAIALAPGETASIVVCAGRGGVRLEHVEVLEVTALGYHYVSGLPTEALGIDPVTALGHEPSVPVVGCGSVDVAGLGDQVRAGQLRWVDVVDFYSRHSCARWQIPPGYRYAEVPLSALPASAGRASAKPMAP